MEIRVVFNEPTRTVNSAYALLPDEEEPPKPDQDEPQEETP